MLSLTCSHTWSCWKWRPKRQDAVSSRMEAGKEKVGEVFETTAEVCYLHPSFHSNQLTACSHCTHCN